MPVSHRYIAFLLFITLGWGILRQVQWHSEYWGLQYNNHSVERMEVRGYSFEQMAFPVEEITWLKAHEIAWKGQKFDIQNPTIVNDTLYAAAYHDKEEMELEERFSDHHSTDKDDALRSVFSLYFRIPENNLQLLPPQSFDGEQLSLMGMIAKAYAPGVFIPPPHYL